MLCILTCLLSWHGPVANFHDSLKGKETTRLVPVHQIYSLNVCLSIHFPASYLCNLSILTHSSHWLSTNVHHANTQGENQSFMLWTRIWETLKRELAAWESMTGFTLSLVPCWDWTLLSQFCADLQSSCVSSILLLGFTWMPRPCKLIFCLLEHETLQGFWSCQKEKK